MNRIILLTALVLLPLVVSAEVPVTELFLTNPSIQDSSYKDLKTMVLQYLQGSWCSPEKTQLLMDLVLTEQPKVCVEIGAFTGSSILPIAATLKYVNQGVVFAIDAWSNIEATKNMDDSDPNKVWWSTLDMNNVQQYFHQMLDTWELKSFCKVIPSTSQLAVNKFNTIDFLHIDGDYSEKGSVEDVMLYLPKVRQNGYILISNLQVFINKKYLKQKAFALLFDECEVVCRIEKGNAVLLRKL